MTAGGSRAGPTITPHPALAPSPQPRPAPTARALIAQNVERWGPSWMPIRGPDWAPVDSDDERTICLRALLHSTGRRGSAEKLQRFVVLHIMQYLHLAAGATHPIERKPGPFLA